MRATTRSIIAASLLIRKPRFTLKLPVLNQGTDVSKIGPPVSTNTFAKKLTAIPSELPIRVKATQWAELPIFFPKNMRITKDRSGKNKLSKARIVE
jgi:hypothetical protein